MTEMILARGRGRDSHNLGKVLPTLVKHQQNQALPHALLAPLQGSGYGTSQRSLDTRNKLKQGQRLHRVQQKQRPGHMNKVNPSHIPKPQPSSTAPTPDWDDR